MFSTLSQNRTVCEMNGELIMEDTIKGQYFDSQVSSYPQVLITPETLRRSAVLNENAQSAFIEHTETLAQKLKAAWYGHGVIGVLTEISDSESTEVRPIVKKACQYLLVSLRWINGMQFTLFPHLKLTNEELISTFAENNDWLEGPIRYLAWHSSANKFALALRDDTVRIYYSDNDLVPMLKHKYQRNVSVVAWKPYSASSLAVGTQTGILIWNVDPSSLLSRPSASAVQILSYSGHSPITSIAWSPQGQDHLFAVSSLHSAFVVWDVSMKQHQVIQHMGTSGGITRLSFSPDGCRLMAATPTSSFRVFEAATWTNERWSKLAGRVQSSCWNPQGTVLLFSLRGDPRIYSITFPDSRSSDLPAVNGSKHASVVLDLTHVPETVGHETSQEPQEEEDHTSKKNFIHSIIMDGSGERLAVLFSKDDPRHKTIALYAISFDPVISVSESGFVNEEEGAFPNFIAFKPGFDKGALLTVCYSNGIVRYIPLYFKAPQRNINAPHQQLSPMKSFHQSNLSTLHDTSQTMWTTIS